MDFIWISPEFPSMSFLTNLVFNLEYNIALNSHIPLVSSTMTIS